MLEFCPRLQMVQLKNKKIIIVVVLFIFVVLPVVIHEKPISFSEEWEQKIIPSEKHNPESVWNSLDSESKRILINRYGNRGGRYKKSNNNFFIAEREYFLGKVRENKSRKCGSIRYYKKALDDFENKELLYEILYFVSRECGRSTKQYEKYLLNHSMKNKRKTYHDIINDNKIPIKPYKAKTKKLDVSNNYSKIVLGKSYIKIDNNSVIGSQVERVIRDWQSGMIDDYPPAFNFSSKSDELISYHEGYNLKRAIEGTSAKIIPLTGTIAVKSRGNWYAPDEEGSFRFEVLQDKVNYPSNKCFGNVCLIIDTHGISALVSQALHNNISTVIGCGDYTGKMAAAQYLAKRGVDVFFPADRFIGNVINYKGSGKLIGTAPIERNIIGNQIVKIEKNSKILIQGSKNPDSGRGRYYDAPKRYFEELEKKLSFNAHYIKTKPNKTSRVVYRADKIGSSIIAVRVWTKKDYLSVKNWLEKDDDHKAILFHSGLYPLAKKLFSNFENQTSFGDPKPKFV